MAKVNKRRKEISLHEARAELDSNELLIYVSLYDCTFLCHLNRGSICKLRYSLSMTTFMLLSSCILQLRRWSLIKFKRQGVRRAINFNQRSTTDLWRWIMAVLRSGQGSWSTKELQKLSRFITLWHFWAVFVSLRLMTNGKQQTQSSRLRFSATADHCIKIKIGLESAFSSRVSSSSSKAHNHNHMTLIKIVCSHRSRGPFESITGINLFNHSGQLGAMMTVELSSSKLWGFEIEINRS